VPSGEHGFTRVDDEARPAAWIECLDKVHREPFYRDYKDRIRAILAPRATGLYLDVGAGVGTDARALGAKVIAVDKSLTMCRESRARGQTMPVAADAEALPFPSGLVDGCWSDRTFQHLAHPQRALAELIRVMKPGAVIVLADPDYGTQAMAFPDQGLAGQVLSFRAHHLLRNGTLAHRMGGQLVEAGLEEVSVEERRLIVRDPTSVDNVMGLRSWARTASARGLMNDEDVARWETLYDQLVAEGGFLWSVSFFITSGRKPALSSQNARRMSARDPLPSRLSWAGYAAAAWALIFGVLHLVWAAGWYIGLPEAFARQAFQDTRFLVWDVVAGGLCLLAVPVGLAVAQPWGRRVSRRLVGLLAWGVTALLGLRGAAGAAQAVYFTAIGRKFRHPAMLWWEAWFCLGAILFGLGTWAFWRASRRG
jgi:SAM-dependent methyltransferase